MDWYALAKMDWELNQNPERLHDYVEFGKITEEQFEQIKEG
jgi:hypothetical protein